MIQTRVEKYLIKKSDEAYSLLDHFCFLSKNLYNHANYIVRNEYIRNKKWIRYNELDRILKADQDYPDYRNMPTAQSAQQILRLLDKNWNSFFASMKDWGKHKEKYSGRPKLPKYKAKDGRTILILTNQNAKLKDDGLLHFPKCFQGFTICPRFMKRKNFSSFL